MQAIKKQPKLELVNSLLHVAGVFFGLIFIPYLLLIALKKANNILVAATGMYGLAFIMVFTFSSLYHGLLQPKIKHLFEILDHVSIYFLIAGTYTPLVVIFVNTPFGVVLLIALWFLTIIGSLFKLFFTGKFEILSTIIYILMGLLLLTGGKRFFISIPPSVTTLIITGVGLYCMGVIFYLWKKFTYHHAIWHLFVLTAAICHYFAILIAIKNTSYNIY